MAAYVVQITQANGPDTVTLDATSSPNVLNVTDGSTFASLTVNANTASPLIVDPDPTLSADLDLNGNDITGTGNITTTGKAKIGGGADASANADELVASKDQTNVGISILSEDATGFSRLLFGSQTNNNAAKVQHNENNDQLTVQAAGDLRLQTGGTNDRVTVDSSGNFLVGKTTQGLTNTGFEVAQTGQASATQSGASALRLNRLASNGELLQFRKDNATAGKVSVENDTDLVVDSTDDLFLKAGADTGVALYQSGGTIESLRLYSGGSERLRIASDGKIGIGTSSPTSAALVVSGTGLGSSIRVDDTTNSVLVDVRADSTGGLVRTASNDPLVFATNQNEAMRIDSDGSVGINVTSPSATLDVDGTIKLDGNYPTGTSNVALGNTALNSTDGTANYNIAIGDAALTALTTGDNNVAVGYIALQDATTASENTAIGVAALGDATTGGNNVAVGRSAMRVNTTGVSNVAVGADALDANTTASNNTAVGSSSLGANTTGTNNVAMGVSALTSNTTGSTNTALGRSALAFATTASNNTAVGHKALNGTTEGGNNTAVGYQAGDVITTGVRNTILGRTSDPSAADASEQVVIGYSLTGKGDETAFIGGTNGAYNEKNVTTWETTSDQRIKKNIVDNDDGLSVLSQIQVRNFEYRTPDEITDLPSHAAVKQDGTQIGVIAQEIQRVLPECVSENSTGVLSVNTDPLVWYLINAVKELNAEIEQLKGS